MVDVEPSPSASASCLVGSGRCNRRRVDFKIFSIHVMIANSVFG